MIAAKVLPMGDAAVLLEVADSASVLALHHALREGLDRPSSSDDAADPFSDVIDLVPAAQTVLLHTHAGVDLSALGQAAVDLAASLPDPAKADPDAVGAGERVEIAVTYDGDDLDDVAQATGLSRDEVIAAHTGSTWRVDFFGFAPGFAYLSGGDPRLQVARRSEPRTSVPPGSVGLAGEFSAVYPRSSPGGWQLIGRTDAAMWDETADPPSLLQPGSLVRFVQSEEA